jgi:endo-1,4-beta-xylanase
LDADRQEFHLTEFDVRDDSLPYDYGERDRLVAERAKEYLQTIFAELKPTQILTWGLSDRHTWLMAPDANPSQREVRPLPLDRNMRRKPIWHALNDCLAQLRS